MDVHRRLTGPGSSFTTSRYRELTAGRTSEADNILGDYVLRAHGAAATHSAPRPDTHRDWSEPLELIHDGSRAPFSVSTVT